MSSKMSTDTKELVENSALDDAMKRQPFDLRSQMISEITELMSKDSMSGHAHIEGSQDESTEQDGHLGKSRFEDHQRASTSIMVTNEE